MKNPHRTQHDPRPLFSASPPQREWVGLTTEERHEILRNYYADMESVAEEVEDRLKEKNT